jgi:signal transduction histidine kinase/ActR/RegA family two-component response regulator
MALALCTNQEYDGEEIIVERPDGRRFTVLAHANPIRDESGKLLGAVNVVVDISDRKQAEDGLRQASRAKDEFLATLAHELRNPLAPIRNAMRILESQGELPSESYRALEVINRQMQQMTRLIEDLLDVSRITRNKVEMRKERVELIQVIQIAVETSRPLLTEAGHELTITAPAQPIYLQADQTRLAQAISNLLNNSAKYTEPGGQVWLTVERQGSDAVVTVRDNGIGIPADMLPRIFDMFAQVDHSPDRVQGGLGIGLTLVKRLVELHGGSIRAESEGLGLGSRFVVRLPIVPEPALETLPTDRNEERTAVASSLRVLVVDDNKDSAVTLSMFLRIMGNDIRSAFDGEEALQVAREFRPQVVVLDIGLPKLSGYEVARKIREEPWGRDMVLIAVTGWGQEEDKQRSKEAGFDRHMVKPVDPAALTELLASFDPSSSDHGALGLSESCL